MQCKATTKKGKPCPNKPLPGSEYCFSHKRLHEETDEPKVPAQRKEEVNPDACGHVNMHVLLKDETGHAYHPVCDLEPGHEGNHAAWYQRIDYKNEGIVVDQRDRTHWTDMAGIPADQIKPDMYTLPKNHPQHPNFEEFMALVKH